MAIEMGGQRLPTTFVPGRNLIFLAFAGALAYRRGARHLVAGMCENRLFRLSGLAATTHQGHAGRARLGMDRRFVLHAPLMWIDKAGTCAGRNHRGKPMLIW